MVSSYFKDIYLYLAQNKLPNTKTAIKKVETLAERYILLDFLLFKFVTTLEKERALLAIPEVCTDKIITLYHSSLFAGHQRVIKTYLTISDKFFIPNLIHYLCSYIKGCHICQLAHKEEPPVRKWQTRININYRPLSRLSMDLKVMPRSYKGHKNILCIIDEVTNYFIIVPLHQSKSEEIGDALIENIITKYCKPEYIIMELFLVKHKSKYSCESAIYFYLGPEIIKENCKCAFYYNKTDITPTVLNRGNKIILANWSNDKHIICSTNNDIPVRMPSHPYLLVNRSLLCNCDIGAENNFLLESLAACHNANSKLVMYFTVNTALSITWTR